MSLTKSLPLKRIISASAPASSALLLSHPCTQYHQNHTLFSSKNNKRFMHHFHRHAAPNITSQHFQAPNLTFSQVAHYSIIRTLSNTISSAISSLKSSPRISPQDLKKSLDQIEQALIEADVSAPIVKKFIEDCYVDYDGLKTDRAMPPSAAVYAKIKERLVMYLGGGTESTTLNERTILMIGTQGSGKTTTAAKLAHKLRNEDFRVLTVSLDTTRPAAMQQLQIMSQRAGVDFFEPCLQMTDPIQIAEEVIKYREKHNYDSLIVDTAGRMHVDSTLMKELEQVAAIVSPSETLLVADAMLGNDSVKIGREFSDKFTVDGIIMSRFDSNARGGATISMKYVTGAPIKYVGVGENVQDLEVFIPKLAATRILGEGDIDSLATQYMSMHANDENRDYKKEPFTMDDFINYMDRLNRSSFVQEFIDTFVRRFGVKVDNEKMDQGMQETKEKMEEYRMIYAEMLPDERKNPLLLKVSSARRMRVIKNSGVSIKRVQECLAMFEGFKQEFSKNGNKKVSFTSFKDEMTNFMSKMGSMASAAAMKGGRRVTQRR